MSTNDNDNDMIYFTKNYDGDELDYDYKESYIFDDHEFDECRCYCIKDNDIDTLNAEYNLLNYDRVTIETYQCIKSTSIFDTITKLIIWDMDLNDQSLHCELPKNLEIFIISNTKIKSLPKLPDTLLRLNCGGNNITEITKLPPNLKILNCMLNKRINISCELPQSLIKFDCSYGKLKTLPKLPDNLLTLICHDNNLRELPKLPQSLIILDCSRNMLEKVFHIPKEIKIFNVRDNPNLDITNISLIYIVILAGQCYTEDIDITNTKLRDNMIQCEYEDDLSFNWKCRSVHTYDEDIGAKYLNKMKNDAGKIIANWFLECKYNPKYKYCRDRLKKECEEFYTE